eukprot:CAMPEP_0178433376 /NCGR_PEP_ID=MMETSP0689_2-20121128/32872_1 /TAXON_ID=160604 /ORGANISM="Amphidinium massartii, Strain CS-259" /LENGTH=62 /DNA_ID=CAMNT_0020055399 /DNA_START=47 /DNA_END=232 /DNA_ORIENTATION=-
MSSQPGGAASTPVHTSMPKKLLGPEKTSMAISTSLASVSKASAKRLLAATTASQPSSSRLPL